MPWGPAVDVVAHPDGAYPANYAIVARVGQTAPQDLLVASTYGFLISHDGGATWRWGCEGGFGVFDTPWEPEYELTAGGAITATTIGGLVRSLDGCTWTPVAGDAGTSVASTTTLTPDGTLYLGSGGSGASSAVVLRSTDDGMTFQPLAPLGDDINWIESLAVAPSNPLRLYATGAVIAGERQVWVWRSDDGGASWTALSAAALAPQPSSELQILAVDPTMPDRLFARLTQAGAQDQDALFRSDDGGATWTAVLRDVGFIPGLAIRPSGAVVIATKGNGLYRSADGVAPLERLAAPAAQVTCLREMSDGLLWICTDNFPTDRVGLGTSSDAQTWTTLMTMLDLAGPIACPAGTVQADECNRGQWCSLKERWTIPSEDVTCVAPDAGMGGTEPPPGCIDCASGGKGATPTWILVLAMLAVRAGAARCARAHGRASRT